MGGKLNTLSTYRTVDGENGDFAAWVRNLSGWSGVYIIRKRTWLGKPGDYLYIGESHTHRLYETLTRHFQSWEGPQARTTYDRHAVLVAVKFTRPGAAIDVQDVLISTHEPADNIEGVEDAEEAPF